MERILISLITLIMLALGFSCTKILGKDDVLTLHREDYLGSALRFDGIFYTEKENSKGPYFHRYALYRNGIIRDLGGSTTKDDPNFLHGNTKIEWGVFQINGANIKFERWYPGSGGPFKAYIRSGEILNDSTFLILEIYRMKDGKKTEISEINEIYHFIEFSPKPDSTNAYVP
jgi:hypothetical protein